MKYILWLFLGVLLVPQFVFAEVKINEVAWMGTAKSQYSEWIELYNNGEEAVNLAGWKLYKAASEVVFTMTKSIAPKSYLLIERTTASAPDAVLGINDEAGAFGAGGLRNTGEDLILKNKDGTSMDSVSSASGWPAGDTDTYKSMQWNGEKWITAVPTPDAVNASVTDVVVIAPSTGSTTTSSTSPSTTNTNASTSSTKPTTSTKSKSVTVKSKMTITPPKNIFQGVKNEYDATFEIDATLKTPQGYFYWNMGDGTTYIQSALAPIAYTYHYPGTYTASLSYYSSATASKPFLQTTASVAVITPIATLETINGGTALQITNNTTKAMDIGHWPIGMTEGSRAMPDLTVIAAKAHITISAQMLGVSSIHNPTLSTPDGTKVVGKGKK
ncbi:MAG: lamin tail domain-containing protein [Candidatus Paceibacterota bacterium]